MQMTPPSILRRMHLITDAYAFKPGKCGVSRAYNFQMTYATVASAFADHNFGSAWLVVFHNSHPVQQLLLCCAGNPDAAVNGGLAIAVPLELKGLWLAHQRHGSLAWADLVTPVIPLAQDGFPLHPYLADEIDDGEW